MTKPSITNIHVSARGGWNEKMTFSLGCETDDARFHVWCNAEHKAGDTLYKNPPHGIAVRALGWYSARHLRAETKASAVIIDAMMDFADANNLWQQAIDAEQARQNAEAIQHIRAGIAHAKRDAGEQLHTATKMLLQLVRDLMPGIRHLALQDYQIVNEAPLAGEAALAAAEPSEKLKAAWLKAYGQAVIDIALDPSRSVIVIDGHPHGVMP